MIAEPATYLFSWENIPGNDSEILLDFLKKKYGIDWVKTAKIDDGKIIKVTAEKKYLLLSLNDEKTEVSLLIDDGRIDKFKAKTENGKLNVYPPSNDHKSGIWRGDFMEGTWCGTGEWESSGKWEGKGKWKSGILKGDWKGRGTWSKYIGNDYEGDWKGSGTLWENNVKKLGSTFTTFSLLSFIGIILVGIVVLISLQGLKDFPIIFVGAATLVLVLVIYLRQMGGKWYGTGRWTENQGVRMLTIVDGHWKIAGLKGELSGTIKECK